MLGNTNKQDARSTQAPPDVLAHDATETVVAAESECRSGSHSEACNEDALPNGTLEFVEDGMGLFPSTPPVEIPYILSIIISLVVAIAMFIVGAVSNGEFSLTGMLTIYIGSLTASAICLITGRVLNKKRMETNLLSIATVAIIMSAAILVVLSGMHMIHGLLQLAGQTLGL